MKLMEFEPPAPGTVGTSFRCCSSCLGGNAQLLKMGYITYDLCLMIYDI